MVLRILLSQREKSQGTTALTKKKLILEANRTTILTHVIEFQQFIAWFLVLFLAVEISIWL